VPEQSRSEGAKYKTVGTFRLILALQNHDCRKNVIFDEISPMQFLPVLINGLPHLTC